MHQLNLFDSDGNPLLPPRFAAFVQFHRANPRIYGLFIRFALEGAVSGRKRFGARMVGERIRWYCNVETRSKDEFKVNDHHWPYYARMAMLDEPSLEGIFERRDAHFDASDEMLLQLVNGVNKCPHL